MFSLVRALFSPGSAEDRSSLFVWFIDNMARSRPISGVRGEVASDRFHIYELAVSPAVSVDYARGSDGHLASLGLCGFLE